jgi:hypothetical protein
MRIGPSCWVNGALTAVTAVRQSACNGGGIRSGNESDTYKLQAEDCNKVVYVPHLMINLQSGVIGCVNVRLNVIFSTYARPAVKAKRSSP